jgi:DNA polymerase I-like protein with 3'-5' exonuclease and polymerase domains
MPTFPPLPEWVQLEHQVAHILQKQEEHGWYFDERAAYELESTLRGELEEATEVLRRKFGFVAGTVFTPKRNNRTQGYVQGCPFTKLKQLNPTSRDHIAWILQTHENWKPTQRTATGKPVVDETVLKDIGSETALLFLKCLDITKKLGMISEGVNAWQKLSTTCNRIHHHCGVATSTFRCAHRKPNLAQVPSDERFRKLFRATPTYQMVSADLSGIELRMLAHYLSRYDNGRYQRILTTGDIHQTNADRIGITRRQVKTVTYAFLYGAGNTKLGYSYDKLLSEKAASIKGAEIRKAYIAAIPGLADLLLACEKASKRGYANAIDGRRISVDKGHKFLNYLLQGSAATIAKRWMVIVNECLPPDGHQLSFVHDELNYECYPRFAEEFAKWLETAARMAGEHYNLRCPIAAEAKIGYTWADVH